MDSRLAMDGGVPVRTEPFHPWPVFDEREEQALLSVLHSGHWGVITGTKVAEFEQKFAAFQDARFGICVPNGTLALELALAALGIGPGDEVITPPYTFIATSSAILHAGATPVYVDIETGTHNINPQCIRNAITERTRAILPVHLAGRPANLDEILLIANEYHLFVLEDACQAWGSAWRGKRVGALGNFGTFSFQASKNITAGEGGIVLTNDPELAERCWSLHNVGRIRNGLWYQHELLGWNLRLPEWEGAILQVQLDRLQEHMPVRDDNVRYLTQQLRSSNIGLLPPQDDPRITSNAHHLLILSYQPESFGGHSRNEFVQALTAEGITPVSNGYVPLHRSPAIRHALGEERLSQLSLPVADYAGTHSFWINQNVFLGSHADMDSILEAMEKIHKAWR